MCWREKWGLLSTMARKATSASHGHFPPKGPPGYRISLGGDENVEELDRGDGCPSLGRYKMPLNRILEIGWFYVT